ncbi:MAG: hypothetical protein LBE38_03005 [Deltaproteobacteria bacterium]|jgi:hypothetical protein|nr:hypothetical protein [Deltaproteobacteria bacterium]
METVSENPTPRRRKWPYVLGAILLIILFILLFLPSYLLKLWLNRTIDTEELSDITEMRAGSARVSPLLTGFTIKDLTVVLKDREGFSVESIEAKNLKPGKVFKMLFGYGDQEEILNLLSGDATLVVRGLTKKNDSQREGFNVSLGTFSLGGLEFKGETIDVSSISVRHLKVTDFFYELAGELQFTLGSFAAFGLNGGTLNGLTVSSVNFIAQTGTKLAIGDFAISGFDFNNVFIPRNGPTIGTFFSFLDNTQSLDLAVLDISLEGKEGIFINKFLVDTSQTGEKRVILTDFRVNLLKIDPDIAYTPEGEVFFDSLGPILNLNAEFRGNPQPDGYYQSLTKLNFPGALDLELSLNTKNLRLDRLYTPQGLGAAFISASYGQGHLTLSNRGVAERLYPSLSEVYFYGAPAKEGILNALDPVFSALDPAKVVNVAILQSEIDLFLSQPRTISIMWNPIEGFPRPILTELTKLGLSETQGTIDPENFKYAIIAGLNLALVVNERAPIFVTISE